MKNILKTTIFAFLLVALGSCENDIEAVATKQEGAKLLAPATGTEIVLAQSKENDIATTLVWDYSNFGVETSPTYVVEFAIAGTKFQKSFVAGTTPERFISWTQKELNTVLLDNGFKPFIQSSIDVRILAQLGTSTNALKQYSNSITLKVTPYPAWDDWGIIGDATPNGWDSDTDLVYDAANKKYTYEGKLKVGEYKFRKDNDWAVNRGDNGGDGTLEQGGANIKITVEGNYLITIDFKKDTYTVVKK